MENKQLAGVVVVMCLMMAVIGVLAELYARAIDKVRIYERPAELRVIDPGRMLKVKFPVSGIDGRILTCGQYTGKYRECVVEYKLNRGGK